MFVFQDLNIVNNPALYRPLRWTSNPTTLFGFPRRRALVWLTYWFDAQFHGEHASRWRHTSMLIHIVNAALLAQISGLAALLFLVHPLTSMGHSYVAGRSGALQTTFLLMALLSGHLAALALVFIASRWVKEDSVVFFLPILLLW